jgi:hypothetical protein
MKRVLMMITLLSYASKAHPQFLNGEWSLYLGIYRAR